jgi:hypothetical protein
MSWLVVFLSYLLPTVLLSILLAMDWLLRQSTLIPSRLRVQRRDEKHMRGNSWQAESRRVFTRLATNNRPLLTRAEKANEGRRVTMATAVGVPARDVKEKDAGVCKQLATATRCSRCAGLMVIEPGFDLPSWRCVQCGELIDPVILQNRRQN